MANIIGCESHFVKNPFIVIRYDDGTEHRFDTKGYSAAASVSVSAGEITARADKMLTDNYALKPSNLEEGSTEMYNALKVSARNQLETEKRKAAGAAKLAAEIAKIKAIVEKVA